MTTAADLIPPPAAAGSINEACADLAASLAGIELPPGTERCLTWLYGWDQPTLHALAEIIRAARHAPAPTLGEQLDAIGKRLDTTTQAWAVAGYPSDGPLTAAREAVFADLRAWNEKTASHAR